MYDGRWAKIAKKQSKQFFNPSNVDMMEQAKRLVYGRMLYPTSPTKVDKMYM